MMDLWTIAGLLIWVVILVSSLFGKVEFIGDTVHNPVAKLLVGFAIGMIICIVFGFFGVIARAMIAPVIYLFSL